MVSAIRSFAGLFVALTFGSGIVSAAHATLAPQESETYCSARVRASICVASPMRRLHRRSDVLQRRCLPGSEKFVSAILESYRRMPRLLQQQMCKLERIFIEQSFWASGYAHPKTNTIGIHRRMFEEQKSLSKWATWKERLPFAKDDIADLIIAGQAIQLPRIKVNAPDGPISSVFFILAHELAHRIDLERGLSRFPQSSFAKISWRLHKKYIKSAHLPPSWTVPCFYRCDEDKLSLSDVRQIYSDLLKGGFVSLYASRHPSEDFAETLTYYVMTLQKDLQFELQVGPTKIINLESFQRNQLIRQKFDYMRNLLNGQLN